MTCVCDAASVSRISARVGMIALPVSRLVTRCQPLGMTVWTAGGRSHGRRYIVAERRFGIGQVVESARRDQPATAPDYPASQGGGAKGRQRSWPAAAAPNRHLSSMSSLTSLGPRNQWASRALRNDRRAKINLLLPDRLALCTLTNSNRLNQGDRCMASSRHLHHEVTSGVASFRRRVFAQPTSPRNSSPIGTGTPQPTAIGRQRSG